MILLANALLPLLEHESPEVAMGAAALLADPTFRGLTRRRSQLFDLLIGAAKETSKGAAWRLRFAQTAHAIGSGAEGREARELILGYLDSQDAELRARGALTLASLRGEPIDGQLREELERLSRIPNDHGALATAILKRASEKEFYERRNKDARARFEEGRMPEDLEEFVAVMRMVQRRHLEGEDVDREDLVEAGIDGMLRYMDLHSSYLSPEAYARFFQDLEADYGGIGAYVDIDPDDGIFTIQRPIYSGPAYEAGLLTGDRIVRIDDWPTIGQDREDIIKRLKGKPGTPVKLYIWQAGMDIDLLDRPTEEMAVTIDRELIQIPAGSWQMLPGKIGVVELTTFSRVAMEELGHWIAGMQDDGMRALILDMRRNSGGLLTEARQVAELFLPANRVVAITEGRDQERHELRTRTPALVPEDVPVVILTGRYTASAAEIIAGALKDHDRATLVGQVTYGKGSVQQLLPVEGALEDIFDDVNQNMRWDTWEPLITDHDGDGEMDYAPRVKLTIARYLLPSGRSIHRELSDEGEVLSMGGVEPDRKVKPDTIERWRFEEQRRLTTDDTIEAYIEEHYRTDHELFTRLAVNDGKNPDLYPGFDELVTRLDTTLPRDDVRRVLRALIRRKVQDDRGAEFPFGDFVEDSQMQAAIEEALAMLGEKPEDIAEFEMVFDFTEEAPDASSVASLLPPATGDLRRARALIMEARERGDSLSEESIAELLKILEGQLAGEDE